MQGLVILSECVHACMHGISLINFDIGVSFVDQACASHSPSSSLQMWWHATDWVITLWPLMAGTLHPVTGTAKGTLCKTPLSILAPIMLALGATEGLLARECI